MKNEIFKIVLPVGSATTNLTINEGESIAIVGENCSGKSELLRSIYERRRGITYRGISARLTPTEEELYDSEIAYFDGALFGDPKSTCDEVVTRAAICLEELPENIKRYFGISEFDEEKRLKEIDYYLSLKLALMQVLAQRKKILLLDDLFGLDVELKKNVTPFLKDVKDRYKFTYVIATTDIAFANTLSDWMLIMEDRQVVEYGRTKNLINTPKHPYSQWLIDSAITKKDYNLQFVRTTKDLKPRKRACRFVNICPLKTDKCNNQAPIFTKYSETDWTACHLVK